MKVDRIKVQVNPEITPEQLYAFYVRNNICEQGYDVSVGSRILTNSSVIIGAFDSAELVGFASAMFDGYQSLMNLVLEFARGGYG